MKKKGNIFIAIGIFLIFAIMIFLNFNERKKIYRLCPGSLDYEKVLMEMNGKKRENSKDLFAKK